MRILFNKKRQRLFQNRGGGGIGRRQLQRANYHGNVCIQYQRPNDAHCVNFSVQDVFVRDVQTGRKSLVYIYLR